MKKVYDDRFYEKFNALGFKTGLEITKIDDDLLNIVFDNKDINLDLIGPDWKFNYKKLINISRNFYKSLFNLNKIKYLDEDVVNEIKELNQNGLMNDEIRQEIEECSLSLSPFDLPLNEDDNTGVRAIYLNDKYYFLSVNLANIYKRNVIPAYIHEIAHTQLMSKKGSILNFKNQEVIPIFLELLASANIDDGKLLNDSVKIRLRELASGMKLLKYKSNCNMFDKENILKSCSNIESTLVALDLFDLYCNSSISTQKEILSNIENIFEGKQATELVLDNYDINYELSKKKNLFRKYIK